MNFSTCVLLVVLLGVLGPLGLKAGVDEVVGNQSASFEERYRHTYTLGKPLEAGVVPLHGYIQGDVYLFLMPQKLR